MHPDPTEMIRPMASKLVVALFTDIQSAHGAIVDLTGAGFSNGQISVAFYAENQQARLEATGVHSPSRRADPVGRSSLAWRLRRSFEHDLHRSGNDQMAGQDQDPSTGEVGRPYCVVDLRDTLLSMGVAEDRILLLNRELGDKGVLVLVQADERLKEAESIIERNSGQIRTDTATERPPSAGSRS